jgi:hypothetical protein
MPKDPGRVHVVLVPGFGGFDALGQIEYYAGVTPVFREWHRQPENADVAIDLRYFDNLPTAGVATRAARLQEYLAKRIARGEFLDGDRIALVGHSTGGLDIRRLLTDLRAGGHLVLDGPGTLGEPIPRDVLLRMIRRVVFLSVPHRGTNIANWVRDHRIEREAVLAAMRGFVAAAQVARIDSVETAILDKVAGLRNTNLLLAVKDALAEMNDGAVAPDDPKRPQKVSAAQDAASELGLFLAHMATDFAAIRDLAVPDADEQAEDAAVRELEDESTAWRELGLEVRSYATLGACPFRFEPDRDVPLFRLREPWTWPCAKTGPGASGTDLVYRAVYRACAGGPFRARSTVSGPVPVFSTRHDALAETVELRPSDNDGIVNTASCFLPAPWTTRLVRADHGDIIGHFRLVPAREDPSPSGDTPYPPLREHDAYDILESSSGFEEEDFRAVWTEVFAFCAGGEAPNSPGPTEPSEADTAPSSAAAPRNDDP